MKTGFIINVTLVFRYTELFSTRIPLTWYVYTRMLLRFNSVEIFAPPFISTFCSTSNGNILPFFACLEKNKKSRFRLEIRILLSFAFLQSGATRNRMFKFKILNYSTLISLEKSPNHWISHMPNSPIFDRFSLIILWLYKGKRSVLFLQIFIWLFRCSYKLFL